MKKCNKCGQIKELNEFPKDLKKKCLYVSPCKSCKSAVEKLRVRIRIQRGPYEYRLKLVKPERSTAE